MPRVQIPPDSTLPEDPDPSDSTLPEEDVHLLHLLLGHAEGADTADGQLTLAQPAVGVEV